MRFRFFILFAIFSLAYSALGLSLYLLQVKNHAALAKAVELKKENAKELELRRGQIFFTDKDQRFNSVAQNRGYPIIFANPSRISDPEKISNQITDLLGINKDTLFKILDNPKSRFKILLDTPSKEQIEEIKDLKIKGIEITDKQYRFYPSDELASQLLGFVGVNEKYDEPIGLYGLEKFYNDGLTKGEDIKFTIEQKLQRQAEAALKKLVEDFSADKGTIIIQDPKTGKILALANEPGFDPNKYNEFPVENFLNPAIQNVYEPGSVFKPLTMAAGIDAGALTPETTFVDNGSITLNGKKIENWDLKAHGKLTMTNVIEQSVNTGAVFAEKLIGHERFYGYLKKFGFGVKTEIDLPNEVRGSLSNLERKGKRDIDFATASFGQGTAVTPIQLITAFSSIANGGLLMRPYLNSELEPFIVRRVISEDSAQKTEKMMQSAVEKAKVAAIDGYSIAGKTGTAQIPNFKIGGYTEEYIHTFVGFGPATDPKFVILIKLDKPNVILAGATVVPAFRELAQFVINYYNIPPDKISAD